MTNNKDKIKNLNDLLERHIRFCKDIFTTQGHVLPMWVGQDIDGNLYPITATFESSDDKQKAAEDLKNIFRKVKAIRYVFMLESWMVRTTKDKPSDLESIESGEIRPSQHPDREEVIIIYGEDLGEKSQITILKINRPADGEPFLTTLEETEALEKFSGLFCGLLPEETRVIH